jgi:DNA modification methylase
LIKAEIPMIPVNQLLHGHSQDVLRQLPDGCVDLIVTSPPYWSAVEYDDATAETAGTYEDYIDSLLVVWKECFRVLRDNGKMAINTPIMPIPKSIIGDQHTRHIKNINNDVEASILASTSFLRYSLFIWQKQTSKLMFGSYPFPGNIFENNTVEFINVFVKPGKPPKFSEAVKEANKLSQPEWVDLAQQVWFMYPEDVKREGDHPAPFPEKLPARLIRMYTYGQCDGFDGELVLDPFCGTGTACAVAKRMGRRFIGIDISARYLALAEERIASARPNMPPMLLVGRPRYPGKDELEQLSDSMALGNAGEAAVAKHKRETYGRGAAKKAQLGLDLGWSGIEEPALFSDEPTDR